MNRIEDFMRPMILKPVCKDYIWGGNKLSAFWNKQSCGKIAETWELSCHEDGASVDALSQLTLKQILDEFPELTGKLPKWSDNKFPLLCKLIDAESNLSVQVHPSDEYALIAEGQLGKTEMWYVLDAEETAGVYCGFNRVTDSAEAERRIKDGTITELLNFIEVKKGDVLYIPSGTVHAICAGLTIAEIQENSSVTYRLFDYDRVDSSGNKRELHIEKSLDVIDYTSISKPNATVKNIDTGIKELAASPYFRTIEINGVPFSDAANDAFKVLMVFADCVVNYEKGEVSVKKGETVFIPAGMGNYSVIGEHNWFLCAYVPS